MVQMKTLLVETADDTEDKAKFEHGEVGYYKEWSHEDCEDYSDEDSKDCEDYYSDEDSKDTKIRGRRHRKSSRKSSRKT